MKATIFLLSFLISGTAFSQDRGAYRYTCSTPQPEKALDTSGTSIIRSVIITDMQWRGETLVIKRFGRFKIEGSNIITTYGLNTDNPTIYGRYKVKGDTLILKCRKSIQHFNKLAPKRSVKVKMDHAYKFTINENGNLKTSEHCYWFRKTDQ
ncbi:MAG: hypothetical protein Crog4KO_12210 [Crocinitomicaceae bacterium]